MNRKHLRTGIVLGSLVTLALASAATGQSTAKIWTSDVVADRQRLMKLNGASWADAQAKLKAGNAEAVAVNAETMSLIATHITGPTVKQWDFDQFTGSISYAHVAVGS